MIKKILECVCVNCGKLKANVSNERFKRAQRITNRKVKFNEIWSICKTKNVCEAGEDVNPNDVAPGTKAKFNHGGCGTKQPIYRKDGLKFTMTTKSAKDEACIIFEI